MRSINISNIDKEKPKATCNAKIYNNKCEITIEAFDLSGIAKYVYNNTYSSNLSNYTINK